MAHCDRNDGSWQNGIAAHLRRTGGSFGRRLFKWDSRKIRKSVNKFNENTYFQYLKIFENIFKEKMNFIDKDFTDEFVVKI